MTTKPVPGDSVRFVRDFRNRDGIVVRAETVAPIVATSAKFFAIRLPNRETVREVPRDAVELATESN